MVLKGDTRVADNLAGSDGGGIYNSGDLALAPEAAIVGNSAGAGFNGGGIYNDGSITGDRSVVTGNEPDDVYTP